jgi:hypothetical protein
VALGDLNFLSAADVVVLASFSRVSIWDTSLEAPAADTRVALAGGRGLTCADFVVVLKASSGGSADSFGKQAIHGADHDCKTCAESPLRSVMSNWWIGGW